MLLEVLGGDYIAYVLNVDRRRVMDALAGNVGLTTSESSTLAELASFVSQLDTVLDFNEPHNPARLDPLLVFRQDLSDTWTNFTRRKRGGHVAELASSDPIEGHLLRFAKEMYPAFLTGGQYHGKFLDPFWPHTGSYLRSHPLWESFLSLILEDVTLSQLFPLSGELGRRGDFQTSTGQGCTRYPSSLAPSLIGSGWQLAALEADGIPSLEEHSHGVLKSLRIVRSAIDGEEISVPARVGLWGVTVPSSTEISLPLGRLRSIGSSDLAILPATARQISQVGRGENDEPSLIQAGNMVLEYSLPYRLAHFDAARRRWPEGFSDQKDAFHRIEGLQLALSLATSGAVHSLPKVVASWGWALDPLTVSMNLWWPEELPLRFIRPVQLNQDQSDRWTEWIQKVDTYNNPSIRVAISRTLRAMTERMDAADSIVDSVIALENLFGGRGGELTHRISTSIAWLLASDAGERAAIQKRVRDIYNFRSSIVHGRDVSVTEVHHFRNEALGLTIKVLRAIFSERSDLLTECNDGAARSNRLMLGD